MLQREGELLSEEYPRGCVPCCAGTEDAQKGPLPPHFLLPSPLLTVWSRVSTRSLLNRNASITKLPFTPKTVVVVVVVV